MSSSQNIENNIEKCNTEENRDQINDEQRKKQADINFLKDHNDRLAKFIEKQDQERSEFLKEHNKRLSEFLEKEDERFEKFKTYIFKFNFEKCEDHNFLSQALSQSIDEINDGGVCLSEYSYPSLYDVKPKIGVTFKLNKSDFDKQITDLYIKYITDPENISIDFRSSNNYHNKDKNILEHFSLDEIRTYLPLCFDYTYDPNYVYSPCYHLLASSEANAPKDNIISDDFQPKYYPDAPKKSFWKYLGW